MSEFQLPISYLKEKELLETNILTDLELVDASNNFYNNLFETANEFKDETLNLWGQYYTKNKRFLTDSQKLLKSDLPNTDHHYKDINTFRNENLNLELFIEKYQFISWDWFIELNNNSLFLQCLSVYNITSPVMSLVMPILFLIMPFFILKLQGREISMERYAEVLKMAFANHQFGQLTQLSSVSWEKRVYIIVSFCFYIFQIHQNFVSCIQFYQNINSIHTHLFTVRDYLINTIEHIDQFELVADKLISYKEFSRNLKAHKINLLALKNELCEISEYKICFKKSLELGQLMKCYYRLNMNTEYTASLKYSYGFISYINNLNSIQTHIKDKKMNFCKFSKKKTSFKGAYFPNVENPVSNSYDLTKKILITGPNAAGKTTLLKTTLFNIILSQQIGCGFYENAKIHLYDKLHSYINIPDTSGRDSLFQAEARRCKSILSSINDNPKFRHFCIFDELFSGTNPHEAISSAIAFLKYLNVQNVDYIITTHFLNICYQLESDEKNANLHMNVNTSKNELEYTYKLTQGISEIKGGVQILQCLQYPKEIIDETIKQIDKIKSLR